MTISGKYELLRPLGATGFRSFHARHVLTGQAVVVHFLDPRQKYEPSPPTNGAPPAVDARAQILDAGAYEGTQYLVSYPVEDFTKLGDWLESVAPMRRSAITPSTFPQPVVAAKRAELAASFQDVSPRPPSSKTGGSGLPRTDSGQFTAMFGAPPAAQAAPPSSGPVPAPAARPKVATGEFTAMFGVPSAPAPVLRQEYPTPVQPPRAAVAGSGEFTGMFQTQPPPSTPSAPAPAGYPAAPPAPNTPGEFTRMFQAPGAQPPHPTPPPATGGAKLDHDFSRMFLAADRGPLPPAPSELAKPGMAPRTQAPSQTGEFTMLFSGNAPTASPPRYDAPLQPPLAAAPAWPPPAPSSHNAFEGATQVFRGPLPSAHAAPAPMPGGGGSSSGPGEFTMVLQGAGPGARQFPGSASPAAPSPAGGGGGFALPAAVQGPRLSNPSVTGPSVSASGVAPPSFQAPQLSAPSLSAAQLEMKMPSAPAAPPAAPGSAFPPVLIALLSCVATVAVLAILYVFLKR